MIVSINNKESSNRYLSNQNWFEWVKVYVPLKWFWLLLGCRSIIMGVLVETISKSKLRRYNFSIPWFVKKIIVVWLLFTLSETSVTKGDVLVWAPTPWPGVMLPQAASGAPLESPWIWWMGPARISSRTLTRAQVKAAFTLYDMLKTGNVWADLFSLINGISPEKPRPQNEMFFFVFLQ